MPGEHEIQAEPLRSPGAWYSADVTGEGRGESCIRPPQFALFSDSLLARIL
jgi:hypothetical protein